jgi:DNA-binding transcriptional LysR family regulator
MKLPHAGPAGPVGIRPLHEWGNAMDRLAALEVFVRAVETGSFSAVARERKTTQPAISKQMAALERQLGCRLMNRTTRRLNLTDAGMAYYEQCRDALQTLREASASLRADQEGVGGSLRLATSVGFGRSQIAPRLGDFLARHPRLTIDLAMNDAYVDLAREGIDVSIRIGPLREEGLIARQIGQTQRVICAAPSYLEKAGSPQTPAELRDHNCVVYAGLEIHDRWQIEGPAGIEEVDVRGNLRCNSGEGVLGAALGGVGVINAPLWMVGPDIAARRLKLLLSGFRPLPLQIWAVWPPSRRLSPRVKAVVDYLEHAFQRDPWVAGFGLPQVRFGAPLPAHSGTSTSNGT